MTILTDILFGVFGLFILMLIAWLFSANRRSVNWHTIVAGLALQIMFALLVLKTDWGQRLFGSIGRFFVVLIEFTDKGSEFVFGPLADGSSFGMIFAFKVLPTIIFFSSLMAVLYHLGVMQKIVSGMAWVMRKALKISGAESLAVTANVFIGQTEAPLVVRPYIGSMTHSELMTLMIGGMATIAGGVLAAFVAILGGDDPVQQQYFAKHLISASVMAAPATIVIAKLLMPETQESQTMGEVKIHVEKTAHNAIEAAANGASDGWKLAINVGAMLLAFLALIAMIDYPLNALGEWTGLNDTLGQPLSLSTILGYLLSPIAWVIGVPWADAQQVGALIGKKVVANEFVAYVDLGLVRDTLSEKAVFISTYALCGFANFASIAIQIGGIGGLAPERKSDIARFGLRAVLGGSLATMMTATIAGVLNYL